MTINTIMKQYKFSINGKNYDVTVKAVEGGRADVEVNGTAYTVDIGATGGSPEGARPVEAAQVSAQAPATAQASPAPAAGGEKVTSPLPGVIVEVSVKEGQSVKAGDKVAVLEAMKMENEISATRDGVIAAVHVSKGDSLLEGAPIVTIA